MATKHIRVLEVEVYWEGDVDDQMYCEAVALVGYPTASGCTRTETLRSGGLGGIKADAPAAVRQEVEWDELFDLLGHLRVFGVDVTEFWALVEDSAA